MALRVLLAAVLGAGLVGPAQAQPGPPASPSRSPADAVRATLDAFFDGMRAGDSAAVRGLFAPDARIQALEAGDSLSVDTRSANGFAGAVGAPRDVVWDERIWDVRIRVDGPMADAWMSYVFYLGEKRSHCGVNAMHLVRRDAAWKILRVTYTRRPDCTVPPEVQK
jgi:hypothetical protein